MPTNAQLKATVTALSGVAGTTPIGNARPAGYWHDIVLAVEEEAGASSSASLGVAGLQLRAAVALESMSGTGGTEENPNRRGLLKRIVDALEEMNGQVNTGSLGRRLVLAAQAWVGGEPADAITAPVLTRTSSAGVAPLTWTTALDMDDTHAGNILRVQVATDSGFASITQSVAHFLTEPDILTQDINVSADGFNSPSGLYYLRARIERDDMVNSDWSNTLTDTIASTTMTLSTTDKSTRITLSGGNLTATGNTGGDASGWARSSIPFTGPRYFEVTVVSIAGAGDGIIFGVCNSTAVLQSNVPGNGNTNGGCLLVSVQYPGVTPLGFTPIVGTVLMCAVNPANNKLWFGYNGTWNGTPSSSGAGTGGVTIAALADYYALVGTRDPSAGTVNFGASAFAYTPPTGFQAMP